MLHIARLIDLADRIGQELALSDWLAVDQTRIDAFGAATGDTQWLHVDPLRAAQGPYGTTIAHGFLTLSLLPHLSAAAFAIDDVRMTLNYGLNRVRFPAVLPAGSQVRARFRLTEFTALEGGAQLVIEATFERQGHRKPVCVAESVVRHYTTPPDPRA
jgi:acyl dehydratase